MLLVQGGLTSARLANTEVFQVSFPLITVYQRLDEHLKPLFSLFFFLLAWLPVSLSLSLSLSLSPGASHPSMGNQSSQASSSPSRRRRSRRPPKPRGRSSSFRSSDLDEDSDSERDDDGHGVDAAAGGVGAGRTAAPRGLGQHVHSAPKTFRITILGPVGAGKTSLARMFVAGLWAEGYEQTLEETYYVKDVNKNYWVTASIARAPEPDFTPREAERGGRRGGRVAGLAEGAREKSESVTGYFYRSSGALYGGQEARRRHGLMRYGVQLHEIPGVKASDAADLPRVRHDVSIAISNKIPVTDVLHSWNQWGRLTRNLLLRDWIEHAGEVAKDAKESSLVALSTRGWLGNAAARKRAIMFMWQDVVARYRYVTDSELDRADTLHHEEKILGAAKHSSPAGKGSTSTANPASAGVAKLRNMLFSKLMTQAFVVVYDANSCESMLTAQRIIETVRGSQASDYSQGVPLYVLANKIDEPAPAHIPAPAPGVMEMWCREQGVAYSRCSARYNECVDEDGTILPIEVFFDTVVREMNARNFGERAPMRVRGPMYDPEFGRRPQLSLWDRCCGVRIDDASLTEEERPHVRQW